MFFHKLTPALCAMSVLALAGCAAIGDPAPAGSQAASASSVQRIVADDNYALSHGGRPADQPASQSAPAKEMFAWEQSLRENPAAGSLVFESMYGAAPGINYNDIYESVYLGGH